MGLDLLDFTMRIEKSFGLRITRADGDALSPDVTAGEMHDWVVRLCRERGIRVPPSSWHRVQLALAGVVNKRPQFIRPDTRLRRDLGFEA